MLIACGGGDSGGGNSTSTATPSLSNVVSNIVTSVQTPNYAAGSQEMAAYSRINSARSKCGFGLLAQSAELDKAARAHANYLILNPTESGHFEIAGHAGYTGEQPTGQIASAGYSFKSIGQVIAPSANGSLGIGMLLSVPYHEWGLINGFRDVGIGISEANGRAFLVVNSGLRLDSELQTSTEVRTYPCQGTTEAQALNCCETPSPFPAERAAQWGQPILVVGDSAGSLVVTSAAVEGPSGGVALKAIYGDGRTTDPNNICRGQLTCIIPVQLVVNSTYTVKISGKNNQIPFDRTFTFSTGIY